MPNEEEKKVTGADLRRQDLTCCLVTALVLVLLFFVLGSVLSVIKN